MPANSTTKSQVTKRKRNEAAASDTDQPENSQAKKTRTQGSRGIAADAPMKLRQRKQPAQGTNDSESLRAALARSNKENNRLQKQLKAQQAAQAQEERDADYEERGIESEDDEEDPGQAIQFSSSITRLGTIQPRTPPRLNLEKLTRNAAKKAPRVARESLLPVDNTEDADNDNSASSDDDELSVPPRHSQSRPPLAVRLSQSSRHNAPRHSPPPNGDEDSQLPEETDFQVPGSPSLPLQPEAPATTSNTNEKISGFGLVSNAKLGSKPKLQDYNDVVQAILLRAMRDYEARVLASSPFPDAVEQDQASRSCWRAACRAASKKEWLKEITLREIKLIKARGSRIRGNLLDVVRDKVASTYGFQMGGSAKVIRANRKLHDALVADSAFAYKDPKTKSGYAEHKILTSILVEVIFANGNKSIGLVYPNLFNPITLETIIFCIHEWSTGKRVKTEFTEKDNRAIYDGPDDTGYLTCLRTWNNINPTFSENVRKKLYKRAKATLESDAPSAQAPKMSKEEQERIRAYQQSRSGETDSEDGGGDGSENEEKSSDEGNGANNDAASGDEQ